MNTYYDRIKQSKRIVVKVGTSTLTHSTGKLNFKKMDQLAMVLSDLKNNGREVILVTSGAITAGVSKLGLKERPKMTKEKQAAAAVGQCELMFIYDKLFAQYGQTVAQLLLTKTILQDDVFKENVTNTLETLFSYDVLPIINENDSIAVDELVFGDNDTLSAVAANLLNADLLILLSDIDGLYDSNPQKNPTAKLIPIVEIIDDKIKAMAGDTLSDVGTGGMTTKIHAAQLATEHGIDMIITNGENPECLYDILSGKIIGTLFVGKKQ